MSNSGRHTILLGGIGGDSHSVGLTILRQALTMEGYQVGYLGTQNRLEEFCELSPMCDVVMISCMDGHARYYLRNFAQFVGSNQVRNPLWYVGGNLHVEKLADGERDLLAQGFNRAFTKFIDVQAVLEILKKDLSGIEPIGGTPAIWMQSRILNTRPSSGVADITMEMELFENQRREVLQHWKTGRDAAVMEHNAAFLSSQPSFPAIQAATNEGRAQTLVQPRSGIALVSGQIALFKAFKAVGAKVLSYQIDSLTRNNDYKRAEEAIKESRACGSSTINGFPLINHGVAALRRIITEVRTPLQTRHSTRDPRMLAEISYAGGVTSFEGGAICYNIPYYKDYHLDESIKAWQYVDRLTGLYFERFGIVLDREFFGTLTATLIPPSLAIAINVIEALLAVRQGVKCVSLGYAEQGHRAQDIAAIRVMREITTKTLCNLGYKDVQVNTVFHQYMAAFPSSQHRAERLIFGSAVTAGMSGATRVIVKTPVEAIRIPSLEDNIHGITLVQRGLSEAATEPVNESKVAEECGIIRREVEAIVESVIHCGGGDIAQGVVNAFSRGFLDIPFSPSIYNKGEVMTGRDVEGAVRYLSAGNLQFDRELKQFQVEKMQERRRSEGLLSEKQSYLLVEKDVLNVARGLYEDWPLCK